MKNTFFIKYGVTINFSIIMLSLTVMSVYDILHGAYFALMKGILSQAVG